MTFDTVCPATTPPLLEPRQRLRPVLSSTVITVNFPLSGVPIDRGSVGRILPNYQPEAKLGLQKIEPVKGRLVPVCDLCHPG